MDGQNPSKLECAIQELETFTYSVSHDLRAPLQYIGGFIDLLKKYLDRETPPDQKALHYVQIIQDASGHMAKMLDGLLELSRLGRKQKKEAVFPNELVASLQKEFKDKAKTRKVNLKVGKLPEVQGDSVLLRTVFAELMDNALKFTRLQKETKIEIGTVPRSEIGTVFFVRDNGVGFDNAYVGKLFGPFQRLHSREEFEGLGLGLAKAQKIIRLHGGKVWAESAKNVGATFYFYVP